VGRALSLAASLGRLDVRIAIIVQVGLGLDGLQFVQSAKDRVPCVPFDSLLLETEIVSRSLARKTGTKWRGDEVVTRGVDGGRSYP